jgi:hypothetical protein
VVLESTLELVPTESRSGRPGDTPETLAEPIERDVLAGSLLRPSRGSRTAPTRARHLRREISHTRIARAGITLTERRAPNVRRGRARPFSSA